MERPRRLGVCSWSLRASSPKRLARAVREMGVDAVQLALSPLVEDEEAVEPTLDALASAEVTLASGMIAMAGEDYSSLATIRETGGLRPTRHWERNLEHARSAAALAARVGIDLVSFHAGFLPEDAGDPERATLVGRLREVVELFASEGVAVALETGQESAETLIGVLEEVGHPAAGVNFDPANLVLYDRGEPVEALALLAPRVRQIHVKDARRTKHAGTWGQEVVVGHGDVDWRAFFDVVAERGIGCDLMIERESGDDRREDIRRARELVERELARIGQPLGSAG